MSRAADHSPAPLRRPGRSPEVARRRWSAITLLVTAGMLAGAATASAAAPVIVNGSGSVSSGSAAWVESASGTRGSGNRQVTVSFVVRHDPGLRITGIARDANFDGTDDTATVSATSVTPQQLGSPGNKLASSLVRHTFSPGDPGGFSCPLAGGATRRVNVPLRFRVVDETGQRSGSVTQNWHVVEENDCLGRTDYPVLESVSQSATTAAPNANVNFSFVCDDADSSGTNDSCSSVKWRWRRLNDGATSALTNQAAGDNTSRTFGASFPTRGIYVVEAQLCGEDSCEDTDGSGVPYFWRIGAVMVNETAAPSGSISFSGPGVVGTGPTQSVNAGDAATAIATVSGGGGTHGAAQVIEWDGDDDGVFERTDYTVPVLSSGAVIHGDVSGAKLQQAVTTTTHGLRRVSARLYDNGAIDAADSQRKPSSTFSRQLRVNARPVAEDTRATTDEDTAVELTLPASDADSQPAPLTYEVVDAPEHGSVELDGSTATYVPSADYHGSDSFTFRAKDGPAPEAAWASSDVATVSLTITPVNDAPVAEDVEAVTEEDTPVDVVLVASDVDDAVLDYEVVGAPENGELACDGALCSYSPAPDFHGTDTFRYRVSDPGGESDEATATITVREVLHGTTLEVEPVVRVQAPPRTTLRFQARLTRDDTAEALGGKTIAFLTGGQPACSAETGADGVASCEWTVVGHLGVLLHQGYAAVFAGEEDYAGSSAHAPVVGYE